MGGAPYRVTLSLSDDGSFAFTFRPKMRDGSPFDWPSYAFEYSLRPDDGCRGGGFVLNDTSGIARDTVLGVITLRRVDPHGLRPGRYLHGLRMIHSSGVKIPVFDGVLNVFEGNFP